MPSTKYEPCGLPPANPLVSFWLENPTSLAHHRSTPSLPPSADVIIVGSGISGTLTAYYLLKQAPHLKILMLEARETCGGASGRNGGQIKVDPYIAYEGLKAQVGAEQANEALKFEATHLQLFKEVVEAEDIKCDFHITSAFDLCLNDEMAEIGRRSYHARLRDFPNDMKDYLEITDPEHLERLSAARGAKWGCIYRVGSVHPYKLVNGLLQSCFARAKAGHGSFNLQTHTPVLDLAHQGSRWSVKTGRGTVTAPKVVVCCNGYVSNILPEFANKVVPVRGPCSALALPPPQPSTTPSLKVMRPLFTTYSLKNSPGDFDYMISRQEEPKHIIVGGGHASFDHTPELTYNNIDDTTQIPGAEGYFKAFMPKHFVNYPEPESRLNRLWVGVMGYSSDGLPWVGPVPNRPDGLYTLGGFHGRGMVRAHGSVRALIKVILSDTRGKDAQKALITGGLPRSYLLTQNRLDSDLNVLAHSVEHEVVGGKEQTKLNQVKAKL